jgi:hypothetical protein
MLGAHTRCWLPIFYYYQAYASDLYFQANGTNNGWVTYSSPSPHPDDALEADPFLESFQISNPRRMWPAHRRRP